jgi:endonuclease YncB( thermonuclease family)
MASESGDRVLTRPNAVHVGQVNVYQRAALALSDFIGSRTVSCNVTERDRYRRAVATCTVGGTDLGEYIVEQGWARDWPRYSGGRYAGEEARARATRRGVWGVQCPADLWGGRDCSQSESHRTVV